jgi:hypothetical protein
MFTVQCLWFIVEICESLKERYSIFLDIRITRIILKINNPVHYHIKNTGAIAQFISILFPLTEVWALKQ